MKRIYIAGPYSGPTIWDVQQNVNQAKIMASNIIDLGHAPFCPHLSHYIEVKFPKPYLTWLEIDNEFVKVCDALIRIPGASSGSDKEVALAESLGIPVFFELQDLIEYLSPIA